MRITLHRVFLFIRGVQAVLEQSMQILQTRSLEHYQETLSFLLMAAQLLLVLQQSLHTNGVIALDGAALIQMLEADQPQARLEVSHLVMQGTTLHALMNTTHTFTHTLGATALALELSIQIHQLV